VQYIITALGIVISALMSLSTRTVAANKALKIKIGNSLAKTIILFDNIIENGYIILHYLDEGNIEYKDTIIKLFKVQISNLKKLSNVIQRDFLWESDFHNIPNFNLENDFYRKKNKIKRILSIYGPRLDPSLNVIIEWKTELLGTLCELLMEMFEGDQPKSFYIYDIKSISKAMQNEPIVRSSLTHSEVVINTNDHIRYQKIDLTNTKERKKYVGIALRRLNVLEIERKKLAEFIKNNFELQDII
jgi:hypothetical protein